MLTIEEMQEMLDELAAELPPELFEELNGGIILLPQAKLHEESVDDDLFVLGEYNRGGSLGRYISIYFGSFIRVYGRITRARMKEELRATLRHEFRHHIESLAGADDLEEIDTQHVARYLESKNPKTDDDGTDE
jgi:hypothetical protein